jgi:hypothetical protein
LSKNTRRPPLKATKHQTPRKVTPKVDPVLDSYARHIEADDSTPTIPAHKHERYSRIEDKAAFDRNHERIFGVRTIEEVQRRAGRTRTVYG